MQRRLSTRRVPSSDPPPVWPCAEGAVVGYSFFRLEPYRIPPSRDPLLYEMLRWSMRCATTIARERNLAVGELAARLKEGPWAG